MLRQGIVLATCLALLAAGLPRPAQAELVGTLAAVEAGTRNADLAFVEETLARRQVREQMAALGVEATEVEARLARLTDAELRTLAGRMHELPAGGDALAVIGVVFLVLIILEVVGVIDIFRKA